MLVKILSSNETFFFSLTACSPKCDRTTYQAYGCGLTFDRKCVGRKLIFFIFILHRFFVYKIAFSYSGS